jgi:glycosyltransferase involved in cell wall biosynthesis
VRVARNPRNLGYVRNFGAALQDASSDVLFLCDQDDVWHPDKLATMSIEFECRPGLLALCSDADRIDAAGVVQPRSLFEVLKVSRAEMRRIHAASGFRVLLRRSLATGATMALRRTLLADAMPLPAGWTHDEWLAILAAARGGFDCLERRMIDYRQHAGNQLGMPERDWATRWRDLVRPPPACVDILIARNERLRERLQAMGEGVEPACFGAMDENLGHLRARLTLRGSAWRGRAITILREAAGGRYGRHAAGWRAALRDLLRRD